ncbi:tripartite tricarboxylate transporter substrate-binding protein [Pseudonocardia nantongensis]|uniref:tripartite tricarboxylate transporter substrate-binding protein n=1 Tax=Pseudonocardia nantongensis TaxID=1181885 RepID=UPI0039787E0A
MTRLRLSAAAALAACLLLAACGAPSGESGGGESYPSEEIRLIVPYVAGGPTDIAARALGRFMESDLGRPVLVENLPGASGSTAYQELISSDPDGHTLSMTALPTAVLNYLVNDVGYTREDFAPVGVITQVPSALVVPAGSPYRDLGALFADARANPQQVTVPPPARRTRTPRRPAGSPNSTASPSPCCPSTATRRCSPRCSAATRWPDS